MLLALVATVLAAALPTVPLDLPLNADVLGPVLPAPTWPPAGVTLRWPDAASQKDALVLAGKQRSWSAEVGRPADAVLVAWTVLDAADASRPVASVTLKWADGQTHGVDAKLGGAISTPDAAATGPSTPALGVGGGRAISLHVLRNPRPGEPVASVQIDAKQQGVRVAVFAVETATAPLPFGLPVLDEALTGGFPLRYTVGSPAPPQPDAWRVKGPAGAQGFVTVRDGHLAFQEGGRVRFWGVNLLNGNALPPKDQAAAFADHLAGAGVDLVRLHHVDSPYAGLVRKDRKPGDPLFDPDALDRFDFFVAECKKRGIYVLLEVATQRTFTEADNVWKPDARVNAGHKLLPFFEPDWADAYEAWTRAWLGRTNPYTGLRYADDPAVAMVELANEHSLIVNWISGGIERYSPEHRAKLDVRWNEWLRKRYPDEAALRAAWTGSVNPGLATGETWGAVRREPMSQFLAPNWPTARGRDLYDFYMELERAFWARMTGVVKDLGFRVPIIGTITFHHPSLAAVMAGTDVIDTHLEIDSASGTIRNESFAGNPRAQYFLDVLREAQLDKPYIVSELGHAFPNDHSAEGPLTWAAFASLQDWDALIWLNYANGDWAPEEPNVDGPFELRARTTDWGQSATAAALFRSGAIAPAKGLWVLWRSAAAVREQAVGDRPTYVENRDVRFYLANRLRESYAPDPPAFAPVGAPGAQVGWWTDAGLFVIDTPTLQASLGRHDRFADAGKGEGAGPTRPGGLFPKLDGFAAVSLQSLDGKPIGQGPALLTVAGRMENEGMTRSGGGTQTLTLGEGPARMSRPSGEVRFAWPTRPEVRAVGVDGTRGPPLGVKALEAGWWAIDMDAAGPTMWWEIRGGKG